MWVTACDDQRALYVSGPAIPNGMGQVNINATVDPGCDTSNIDVYLFTGTTPVYQNRVLNSRSFKLQYTPGTYQLQLYNLAKTCYGSQIINLVSGQEVPAAIRIAAINFYGYQNTGDLNFYNFGNYYYAKTRTTVPVVQSFLYLNGSAAHFEVTTTAQSDRAIYMYAPPMTQEKWEGELAQNRMVMGTSFDALSYATTIGGANYATGEGNCVAADAISSELKEYLKMSNYPVAAQNDLENYLRGRKWQAPSYCYYVQDEFFISGNVFVKVIPAPEEEERVWFLLVPQNSLAKKTAKSKLQYAKKVIKKSNRLVANDSILKLFEWGIGMVGEKASVTPQAAAENKAKEGGRKPSSIKKQE